MGVPVRVHPLGPPVGKVRPVGRHALALGPPEVGVGRGESPLELLGPRVVEVVLGVLRGVPRVVVVRLLVVLAAVLRSWLSR